MRLQVAAVDGGLAHMGAVRAWVTDRGEIEVTDVGLFVTERGAGTARGKGLAGVTVSEDNRRRASEVAMKLFSFLQCNGAPAIVIVEAFSRPPHAASGMQLAMALGVLYGQCATLGIPVGEVSPQTIKAALGVERGLEKDASKRAVQEAVDARLWPGLDRQLSEMFPKGTRATDREHPYDAAAALIAAVERDRLRAVLPMRF